MNLFKFPEDVASMASEYDGFAATVQGLYELEVLRLLEDYLGR